MRSKMKFQVLNRKLRRVIPASRRKGYRDAPSVADEVIRYADYMGGGRERWMEYINRVG